MYMYIGTTFLQQVMWDFPNFPIIPHVFGIACVLNFVPLKCVLSAMWHLTQ